MLTPLHTYTEREKKKEKKEGQSIHQTLRKQNKTPFSTPQTPLSKDMGHIKHAQPHSIVIGADTLTQHQVLYVTDGTVKR